MAEVSWRTSLDFSMANSSSALISISLAFSRASWRMKAVIFLSSLATCGGRGKGGLAALFFSCLDRVAGT